MCTLLLNLRRFNNTYSNNTENLEKPNASLCSPLESELLLSGLKNEACVCGPPFVWMHPKSSFTPLIRKFTIAHAIIQPPAAGRELHLVAL